MILKYRVKFLDYWHLSSGLSGGAGFDSYVSKDENMLPYIPGKTIKGLTREMAEILGDNEFVKECFGEKETKQGKLYFANAILDEVSAKEIITNYLQNSLYEVIASTKIGKNGIAEDDTLREIEVVIPIELYGEIRNIDKSYIENIKKSLKMIKRMGLNRNRGLGRCEIIIEESK